MEPPAESDTLAHAVIGAAIEVHRELGPGFLETVYEEALCVELTLQKIHFERQKSVSVHYKGNEVGEGRIDLFVAHQLIVEIKAVESIAPIHMAQVISYLRATELPLGLLINFNVPVLREGIRRVVLSRRKPGLSGGGAAVEDGSSR